MAARSTQIDFNNPTGHTLTLVSAGLSHGEWSAAPPATIAPKSAVTWSSESDGVATGVQGSATYAISNDMGDLGGIAAPFDLTVSWDNPFVGSNSYNQSGPAIFDLARSGGDGDNAVASYVFDWVFTSANLSNGGATTHYQISYAVALDAADGLQRAAGLLANCEADYALMSGWFNNIALKVTSPIPVKIVPGPYASAGWPINNSPVVRLIPGNGSDVTLTRYLLVSEMTEMFMRAQGGGWFGVNEGSAGEGLSRFLASQFLIANGLGLTEPKFGLANSWMNSPRNDYVNTTSPSDNQIDALTGCAILFIYYLHNQLGFSIKDIVWAQAPTLGGVYKNLISDNRDPFPNFKALLGNKYPGTTTIPGSNPDNPFPIFDNSFWQELDGNPATVEIVADGADLYQLHNTGKIWKYTGTPLTGWQLLDDNPATHAIAASGGILYQLHGTGKIWKYVGPPMTGWQQLDDNPATVQIVVDQSGLYQRHNTGKIWQYVGPPMTGWQQLDDNSACASIAADGFSLYQLHNTGKVWRYVGPPMTGWQQLDDNPATASIVASGDLYQLHNTGKIWKYVGPPMTGWQALDENPATVALAPGGFDLSQLQKTGAIWKYPGPIATGWRQVDNNPAAKAIAASAGGHLYQLHNTGKIWRYTGP